MLCTIQMPSCSIPVEQLQAQLSWPLQFKLIIIVALTADCDVQQQRTHDSLCLQTQTFGDPLLFRVTDSDTLADVKPRIQKLLGITDQDFAKWKFAINQSLRPPDYLTDEDNIATRFTKPTNHYMSGTDHQFLGLEHVDAHPHRHRHHTNRYCFTVLV